LQTLPNIKKKLNKKMIKKISSEIFRDGDKRGKRRKAASGQRKPKKAADNFARGF